MIALAVIFTLYAAFVIFCFSGLVKTPFIGSRCHPSTHSTHVRVLVSVHNAEHTIERLVNALKNQTYTNYEVVLTDDGSTDSTLSVLRQSTVGNPNFKVFTQPQQGKDATLRNLLNSYTPAEPELILITDADCTVPPTWVESMVEAHQSSQASMLIGSVKIDSSYPWQATEFLSVQAITIGSANMGHSVVCGGANLAFTTTAWQKVSTYITQNPNGGDMFTLEAMKRVGEKVMAVNNPLAVVTTEGQPSIKAFIKQRTRWSGKGGKYSDREIIAAGIITVAMQLALIASLVLSPLNPYLLWLWVAKTVVDFPLLAAMALRFSEPKLIWYIVPLSVIYPFYVIFVLINSLVRK